MNWCVDNLKIEATATAFMATKKFAGDRKIDLAAAMFDAADRMSLNPFPVNTGKSYLDREPLLVL